MTDSDIFCKVCALYLLDKSSLPLSNGHICEFFVSGNYTDYFHAVSVINSLGEFGLIDSFSTHNVTTHVINDEGKRSLLAMMDRITPEVRSQVEIYLSQNEIAFKEARSLSSNYYKHIGGGFTVHLKSTEEDMVIMDLSFHVGSEVVAKSICTEWKNNYEAVYERLMDSVM